MFGTDTLGRSILARSLFGGAISLAIGVAAAALSVFLGVTVGLVSGYRGGWIDSLLMRIVDVLYGLPYILLIILLKIALEQPLAALLSPKWANFVVLFLAIGAVDKLKNEASILPALIAPSRSASGPPAINATSLLGSRLRYLSRICAA